MKLDALQPILWLFIAAIIISFIVIFVFSWPGNHSAANLRAAHPRHAADAGE